jgi:3-hydroxyisobutyrate dehydrogenase-like beta-hydroxyacid dehydrogenase
MAGMRISVLGMGHMGQALASRLLGGGHDVVVWNRSEGKAGPALDAGASEARSLEEAVARAEAVVTVLADDRAVRSVALGEGGVAAALGPDAAYIDCSTVSPGLAGELATGIDRYLAMPVVGSPDAVRNGQAALYLGGPQRWADAVRPLTSALSERIHRFGSAPEALAAKLTGNYLLLAGLAVLAEAFEIGRAGGLGDDDLKAVFSESPLVAPGLRNRFEGVLSRSPEGWFSMALGGKDVGLGLELARSAGTGLPVAEAVRALYGRADEEGRGQADVAAVGLLYRR